MPHTCLCKPALFYKFLPEGHCTWKYMHIITSNRSNLQKKEKYIYNIYGLNIILYTPSTPALNLSFPWGQEFKKKLGYLKQIKGRDYGYANTLSLDSAGSLRPIDSSWGHLHGHDWTGKGQVMGWPPPVVKLCVHRLVHLHGF